MNIVFLGTPEIAKVCLEEILKTHHKVLAVVTQPDKPTGRGRAMKASPVKTFALERGLEVLEYDSVSKEGMETLKALKPDALVLVAFGQILSDEILSIALPVNLHGSLLPALRGPSPIQTAILEGLEETGVSVMRMQSGVDSGPVMKTAKLKIEPDDTSGTLFDKMAELGAKTLAGALDEIENGTAVWQEQDHQKATFCQMLTKENARIDFGESAEKVMNKVRAFNPNPVAFFELDGQRFKVFKAAKATGQEGRQPAEIVKANPKDGLVIACGGGAVEIVELQAPNGKRMRAKDFLNGKKIEAGKRVL